MPLRDDLLNPIPGESPAGANLRYDPVTDKIKEARREDLDVNQGVWKTALKVADWPAVIKMGGEAIAKRGKDLQIAVWLVDAHIRKEGFICLAPGFQFLHDLLEQYWDVLYPPIDEDGDMEVRSAPLVWLGQKLGEALTFLPIVSGKLSWNKYNESRKVGYETDADTGEKQDARMQAINDKKITAEEFDAAIDATTTPQLRDTYKQLNEGKVAIEQLSEYCDQQFGDFTPSFIKTRDTIEEISQTVRIMLTKRPGWLEEEAPPDLDDFSMGLSTDTEESSVAAVAEFETAAAVAPAMEVGSDVGRQLAAICKTMRSRDPEDAAPYLILRSFVWAPVLARAPMLDRDSIVPPESDLRVKLKRLTADGEWDQVLELTEANMLRPCGKFWLDMQRYAINALEQRGQLAAAKVVVNHVRVLLELLPDLVDITFADDTPAANADTKDWITNFVIFQKMPARESTEGGGESSSDDSSSDFSSDFSLDTPSETPSDTSSDFSTDFSFDTPAAEETPSFDTSSWDSTPAAEPTPTPEPFTLELDPPMLEAEEPPPADTSDEFGQALAAVRDGRTVEGLGIINAILATERSGRQRFRRRTQLAHLLMAAGKGKVAQPLLDQLAAEIEERRLEEWEPGEAIAYPLELLMHCLTSADDERRMQLYTRICRLDPVRAVNCSV